MSPTHQDDASMGGASLARSVTPFQIQDEDEPEVDAQLNSIRPTIPLHSISSPFQDFSIGRRRWEFNKHWRRIRQGVCRVTVPREDENEIYDLRVPVKSIVDGTPIEVARSPFAEALGSPGRFGKPDVGARNISPSRPLTIRDPYSPVPLVPASFLAAPALAHVSVPVPVPAPGSIPAPVSFPAPAPTPPTRAYPNIPSIQHFRSPGPPTSQLGLTRSNTSPGPPDFQFLTSKPTHPYLASSASHVDDAQGSLRDLQQSADALPDPRLKTRVRSAVNGVSALWQTAKRVEQSKEEAQARSQRSLKVLETLADAVGHDPSNIPPRMLKDIHSFEKLLLEICTAMEQGWTSRLFRSNRHGNGSNDFDKRLSELQQKFEETCSQRSGVDTPSVSAGALRVSPDPSSHTLESKSFRRRFCFTELKSRLDPWSSTSADVASTTLKVLEKPGSSVPILNGVVGGLLALLDTAKRVTQSKERAQALSQHSATLAEDVDHDQLNMPPPMLECIRAYKDQLSEVRAAVVPIAEQGWISRLVRLNRNEDILDTSNYRLNEVQQRFTVGIVTQTRVEVSQFQKDTADSLVCHLSYDHFTDPFISAYRIL